MALDFPTAPFVGQTYPNPPINGVPTYSWDGEKWKSAHGTGGGSTVYVSDTPPSSVPDNSLWWESDSGRLYLRYNDGTSVAWVLAVPSTPLAYAARFQKFALAGLSTLDIPVPATATSVKMIATLAPAVTGPQNNFSLRVSVAPGAFLSGLADYFQTGYYATTSPPQSITYLYQSLSAIVPLGIHDSIGMAGLFDIEIQLKKQSGAHYRAMSRGTAFGFGAFIESFYSFYIPSTTTGILALRLINTNSDGTVAIAWGPESYLNVEWM